MSRRSPTRLCDNTLEGVVQDKLDCTEAEAVVLASVIRHGKGEEDRVRDTRTRRKNLHDFLAYAERAMRDEAMTTEALDHPVANTILGMWTLRRLAPLPTVPKGYPRVWGAQILWPMLAGAWCRFRLVERIPVSHGQFVAFVTEVHRALDVAPPGERTVVRAVPVINQDLPVWRRMAADLTRLERIYRR